MYLKDGKAKVELGLAKGRRDYDKREAIAKRDADREIQRALRQRTKG
jgi:SsrA-binding protein